MSDTIDRRVVEMRFDNQEFESRTKTTLGTLEKLKKALNFSHASDGLDQLNKSVKNVNVNGLRSAIDGVQVSFSKMEMLAIHALENISDRVINTGIALTKNLTIDQLSAGWQKYADKTTAVQTIMAATKNQFTDTAEQMEFVNDQLDKLNWFTDETSYNFVDMVSNIGKFTSANVALDDSVTAMEGIATWAAVSGQNATVASRAMYQLSQALGAGAVKLMDWRSIENANMNTYEFKETALETAVSLGILQKEADGVYKTVEDGTKITNEGFRDSLQLGWFTSDVLMKTLEKYGGFTDKIHEVSDATGISATELLQLMDRYREAGDSASEMLSEVAKANKIDVEELQQYMEQLTDDVYELGEKAFRAGQEAKTFQEAVDSVKDAVSTGWMNTFEIIFGDYEEARVRWTALANELWDIFASGAEARNELLEQALGLPEGIVREQTTGWAEVEKAVEDAGIPLAKFIHMCLVLGGKEGEGLGAIEAFKNSLSEGWLTGDIVNEAMNRLGIPIEIAAETAEDAGHSFEEFQRIIAETIDGNYGWSNGTERFRKFTEAGYDYNKMQDAVDKAYKGGMPTLEEYEAALGLASDEELRKIRYTDEEIKNLKAVRKEYSGFNGVIKDTADGYEDVRSGSDLLFDGISAGWNGIKGIFSAMRQGWDIAFPPMTADRLYNILKAFNSVANRFNDWVGNWDASEGTPLDETVRNIRDTFAGLGNALGIGLDALKTAAKFLKDTFGESVGNAVDKILDFTAKISRMITNLRKWIQENNIIIRGLEKIRDWISAGWAAFKGWLASIGEIPKVRSWLDSLNKKIASLGKAIEDAFPNASKRISGLWKSIKELFQNGWGFTDLTKRIKLFGAALWEDIVAGWERLKADDFFGGFAKGLESIWTAIKTLDPSALTDWAKSTWEGIKKFFQPVLDFFSGVKRKLLQYAKDVNGGFKSIGDVVGDAARYLKEHFTSIIAAFAFFLGARAIYNFVSTIINIAKAITSPITTISNAFNSFATAAKGLKNAANALALVEVAGVILALAFAAVELGKVPDRQLFKGLIVIGVLSLCVTAIIGVLSVLNEKKSLLNPKQIAASATGMLKVVELAGAIYLVAEAFSTVLKAVDGKTWDQIWPVLTGIGVTLGILTGLTIALSKFGGTGASGLTGTLLGMAAIVYVLSLVFSNILETITADGVTTQDIENARTILLEMIGAVGVFTSVLALIGKIPTAGNATKVGGGVLAIVVAVKLLISAFNDILGLDMTTWSEDKWKPILGIFTVLALIMAAVSVMPQKAGMNGVGIFAVAASVEILAIAIRTLASLNEKEMNQGIKAVETLLTVLAMFTILTSKGNSLTGKTAIVLIGLSAAILILSGAIALLSLLKPEDVVIGTMAISAMIVSIGVMLALSAVASDLGLRQFAGLAAVILVLTACVVALSFLDEGKVLMGTLAISAMITACGVMMLLSSAARGLKLRTFAGLTLVILALAGSLLVLGRLSPEQALIATATLTAVLGVFTIMSVVLAVAVHVMMIGGSGGAIVALGMLTLVIISIGIVIGYLAESIKDPATALVITLGLAKVMTSTAKLMSAVAALGAIGLGGALSGIAGAILVLGAMAGLSAALGWINEKVPALQETIAKGFPVLRTIGKGLGEVVGGIVEGIFDFDISGLVQKLTDFSEGMKTVAESLTGITFDENATNAMKSLGTALLYLAGADLLNAITSLFGGETSSLATAFDGLPDFGEDLHNFGEKFEGTDTEAISQAATAAESLGDLVHNLPTTGGLKAKILGDPTTLEEFGDDIIAFAGAIKDATGPDGFQDISSDQIKKMSDVADAVTKFKEVQDAIPDSGGILQKIIGEPTDIGSFGTQVKDFATAVKDAVGPNGFQNITKEQLDKIGNVTTAVENILTMQDKIPDTEGWLTEKLFGGKTTIDEFGTQMTEFAGAVVEFMSSKTGIGAITNWGTFDTFNLAINKLITLANRDLTSMGTNLTTFGSALSSLGSSFGVSGLLGTSGFYGSISGIDETKLSGVITQLVRLANLGSGMSSSAGSNLSSLATSFSDLAEASIDDFLSAFENADSDIVAAVVKFLNSVNKSMKHITELFESYGEDSVTAYLGEFESRDAEAKRAINVIITPILTELKKAEETIRTSGQTAVSNYIKEFQNGYTNAKTYASSLASHALSALKGKESTFTTYGSAAANAYSSALGSAQAQRNAYNAAYGLFTHAKDGVGQSFQYGEAAGKNFGIGYENGIKGRWQSVWDAAYSIGRAAVAGLNKATRTMSPSREAMDSANYFGLGYEKGLLSWVSKIGVAAFDLGEEAVSQLNKAIASIPAKLSEYMNFDPVIRPVVDLSGAQQSVADLNAMFNQSIGVAANAASVTGSSVRATNDQIMNPTAFGVGSEKPTTDQPVTFYNTFNITSNDPEEVLNYVSSRLQKQVERKASLWA